MICGASRSKPARRRSPPCLPTPDHPLQQVIGTHLDVATFVLAAIAALDRPANWNQPKPLPSFRWPGSNRG